MNKYIFHILGLAHLPTSDVYTSCAYTLKIVNLIKMLKSLGHTVFLYCGEGSETLADEHIICVTNEDRIEAYGEYDWKKEFFKHDANDYAYTVFNKNAIKEINARKEQRDFLLCPMGNYNKPVADAVGLLTVESGIGYTGVFSDHRVFESYAWMHYIYGLMNQANGNYYDCVIPNYYDPEDFPKTENPSGDYYLFIGRLIQRKGIQVAIEATERLGIKLIVAGQGSLSNVEGRDFSGYKHVEHIGTVGKERRAELYGNAIATFVPTNYIGPFEGVAVESQMCGTPVITSDWGVFSETVLQGETGYRCRALDEFVKAGMDVTELSRGTCRRWALENYTLDTVKWKYQTYFDRLYDLWDQGWYQKH